MNTFRVDGRVVLVTGAARGIGADTARRLVDRGARVALVDREESEVTALAERLGDHVVAFAADVTDLDAVHTAVEGAVDRFGGIDVVVANAGISGHPQPLVSMAPSEFRRVVEINLFGVYNTIHAALPHVIERRGYLLPIASVAALLPGPLLAPYTASKHAVDGFARSLRVEIAHTGTRVGIGYFSFIDTPLVHAATATPAGAAALSLLPSPFNRPIPVGRASAAIISGIEKRSNTVYAPRWVPALVAGRGLVPPFDGLAGRLPTLTSVLRSATSGEDVEEPGKLP